MNTWTWKDMLLALLLPVLGFGVGSRIEPRASVLKTPRNGWERVENAPCIMCHRTVLEEAVERKPELTSFHRLHLESARAEYEFAQQQCVTCHAAWSTEPGRAQERPGFAPGGIFHPEGVILEKRIARTTVRRPDESPVLAANLALRNDRPYTFKPTLDELACVKCHGPDSKLGVILFGQGSDAWRTVLGHEH